MKIKEKIYPQELTSTKVDFKTRTLNNTKTSNTIIKIDQIEKIDSHIKIITTAIKITITKIINQEKTNKKTQGQPKNIKPLDLEIEKVLFQSKKIFSFFF